MSDNTDQINDLSFWVNRLIESSYKFREHCCEFSKYIITNPPNDYWPDIADQLLNLLGDVEFASKKSRILLEPWRGHFVRAVAELRLPKPDIYLAWTIWVVEHWARLAPMTKLAFQLVLNHTVGDVDEFFWHLGQAARQRPQMCRELSRKIISRSEVFRPFDDHLKLITLAKNEAVAVHTLLRSEASMQNIGTIASTMQIAVDEANNAQKIAVLTPNDRELLQAMRELNATSDKPETREAILKAAGWGVEGKKAFNNLKSLDLVKSNKKVGFYLTQKGIDKADELMRISSEQKP